MKAMACLWPPAMIWLDLKVIHWRRRSPTRSVISNGQHRNMWHRAVLYALQLAVWVSGLQLCTAGLATNHVRGLPTRKRCSHKP